MDVDPAPSVGQAIDASPRRSVLPYRGGRKGITAVSCKRHLRPSDSEVAPGRLLLRFSLYSGPATRRLAGTGTLCVCQRLGIGVGAHIGAGQFVVALPAPFQIRGQLVSTKGWTFLNADAMGSEDCDIRSDRDLLGQTS